MEPQPPARPQLLPLSALLLPRCVFAYGEMGEWQFPYPALAAAGAIACMASAAAKVLARRGEISITYSLVLRLRCPIHHGTWQKAPVAMILKVAVGLVSI